VCMYGVLCGDASWNVYSLSQGVYGTLLDSNCMQSNLHLHTDQSISQFICFPKIQLHGYQPHGYRNGQRVLYRLLLITVSVSK
jgi:hypothetical protein